MGWCYDREAAQPGKEGEKVLEKDPRIIPDAIKLDNNVIIKKDEEGKQQYIDTFIDFHTKNVWEGEG